MDRLASCMGRRTALSAGVILLIAAIEASRAFAEEKAFATFRCPLRCRTTKDQAARPAETGSVAAAGGRYPMPRRSCCSCATRSSRSTTLSRPATSRCSATRARHGFRDANSAARLSQAFADLASRGVDLSVVSVISPQLTESPSLDQEKGMLHLKGYFPGQPLQINFEMLYKSVGGRWRLFGLSVSPSQAQSPPPLLSPRLRVGSSLRTGCVRVERQGFGRRPFLLFSPQWRLGLTSVGANF